MLNNSNKREREREREREGEREREREADRQTDRVHNFCSITLLAVQVRKFYTCMIGFDTCRDVWKR